MTRHFSPSRRPVAIKTTRMTPIGVVDADLDALALAIKERARAMGEQGRGACLVGVVDGRVYATSDNGNFAMTVSASMIVGVYTRHVAVDAIVADLREWIACRGMKGVA